MLMLLLLLSGHSSLARTGAASVTAPSPTTQPAGTQLSINKIVNKTTARAGDVLSYTLVISNVGSTTATNVVARDSSTTGLRYVAGSASVPGGSTFSSGTPISTWTVPSISAGQSFSLTFQAIADSSGILYTKATIPGDTVTVCTSVPIKVCTGDTYTFRLTAAPGRSNYKWFKNGVELTNQTTNVLDVTATGAYSLAIDNVSGRCPDFSCCPFVVEEDTLPTFRATILPVTCTNGTVQTNGRITLTNYNPVYTYQYSAGTDFNPATSLSGSPKVIPADGVIVTNLANPGSAQPYTIRVFNASGCYTDVTVTMQPTGCCSLSAVATAGVCQPATNTYSATTVITLTNPTAGVLTVSNGPQSTTFATTPTPTASFTAVFANLLSDGVSHPVTASLPGCSTVTTTYTAPASCSVTSVPTLALSVTPGVCQPATNTYSISGTLSLTNAIVGTASVTDGNATTSVSVSAGATSLPYSLSGLMSGTGSHTLTVSYASQALSTTYTAPASCSVTPAPTLVLSITPGTCQSATNGYSLTGTLSLTNASAGTATITDGSSTTIAIAAGITSVPYSLSGLSSGTGSHTVTVSYASQTISQTYTAPLSCSVTPVPSPGLTLVLTPGLCQTATNGYSVTGTLSLTNAIAGTATITDGPNSTTVSVNAGATSVPYALSGLNSGTGSHTVTVSYASQTISQTYTAPASCSATPVCSLSATAMAGLCAVATNTFSASVVITLTNSTTGVLTVSNGPQSTTFATTPTPTASFTAVFANLLSDGVSHPVTASLPGCSTATTTYTAPASCSVTPAPTLALSVTPGNCQSATNGYNVTGSLSLTNAIAGIATVTDGSSTTTVAINAGATVVPYTLAGFVSGTGSHTLTVSYASQTTSMTYTAPLSCTTAPVCSLSAVATTGACAPTTNTFSVSVVVSLTNTEAGTLTVSLPGSPLFSQTITTTTRSVTALFTGLISDAGNRVATISLPGCATTTATFTAPASCSVTPAPMLVLSITPGLCQTATNGYSLTGTLSLTNASAGTATITDGSSTATLTVNASDNSLPYSLTGLISGTGSHTVTVAYAGQTVSQTYTAPVSCSIAPVCSLSATAMAGMCTVATNTFSASVVVSLTNAGAGTLTISLPGSTPFSQVIKADTRSVTAQFDGLLSDGASHTATISLPDCATATATFTAPTSCSVAVAPVCSLSAVATAGVCQPATNTYSATTVITLTNSTTGVLTVSNGPQSTTFATTPTPTASFTAVFANLLSDGVSHPVTASLPGCSTVTTTYTAPASCSVTPVPTLALSVTPGNCQSATNGYNVTGSLSLTNAIAGTATVTDGPSSTSVSIGAGATSVPYSLSGLSSGTGSHTVTVSYASQTTSMTYTAPLSCSATPAPTLALSVLPGACQPATNTYSVSGTLSLTNASAGTATLTDGNATTSVSVSAGATSLPYSLSGLMSGTGSHTLTVSYASQTLSTTYTAPLSCSVSIAPVCSMSAVVTAGVCQPATNTYSATTVITLTNSTTGVLTVTNGPQSTTFATTIANSMSFTAVFDKLVSDSVSHMVTVSLPGCSTANATYTAPASCSVTPAPSLALSVTAGNCQTATNGYTLTGTLSLTNAIAGIATVTDGPSSTSVSISAGTTSVPYSLSGLSSGTGSHTVTVTYASQTISQTYMAPLPCTTGPICSLSATVTASVCQPATNTFSATVVVTIANPNTATLTVTNAGQTQSLEVTSATSSVTAIFDGIVSDGSNHTVVISLPGCTSLTTTYSAPVSCSVATRTGLSVSDPGICDPATNTYVTTGIISLTNAIAGTATLTDGSSTTLITISAGAISVPYSLSGLISGTGLHTVTVSYLGQVLSQTYTAPASCSVVATPTLVLSITPGICQSATNGYTLTGTLSLTNATAGTATITDGSSTTIAIAAGTTSVPYSLSGLSSGTGSHTVTVSYASQTISQTYTAPLSCTTAVAPVCSVSAVATASVCQPATNTYSATAIVTVLNPAANGTVTVSLGQQTRTFSTSALSPNTFTATFEALLPDGQAHSITASLPGCGTTTAAYTAPSSCSVAPAPSLALSVTPGNCQTATNGYTLTGTLSLTNATAGTATLTDGSSTTSITIAAGTTSAVYSLSGLVSGTGSHTITVSYASQTASTTYTAPASCSVTPVPTLALSVTPGNCQSATNGYNVTGSLSLTNAIAGIATVTDGSSTTTVTINAGATVVPYSLSGFVSGTGSHTLTVSYASQTLSQTYTAPASCSVAVPVTPVCSVSAVAKAISVTCQDNVTQANGQIVLSDFKPAYTYQYSAGASFDPTASLSGPAKSIPTDGMIVNTLTNPSANQPYTVRVYSRTDCYTDVMIVLKPTVCDCIADVCVPFILQQTKRAKRIGDAR